MTRIPLPPRQRVRKIETESFTPWSTYWDTREMVTAGSRGTFCVYTVNNDASDTLVICFHGAGHSALSFSLLAGALKKHYSVAAFDFKAHGDTLGDPAKDLGIDDLVEDAVAVVNTISKGRKLVYVGHSLGGSVATRVIYEIKPIATVVIDTVEGIATASMPKMMSILRSRPEQFETVGDAITYLTTSGEVSNKQSALVSGAGRLREVNGVYQWIADLAPSQPFWDDWFRGFANAFLNASGYKILVLPSIENLDTPFTIGHMSGKFQLSIINESSHCVMEDYPTEVAKLIRKLLKRIQIIPDWKANWGLKN